MAPITEPINTAAVVLSILLAICGFFLVQMFFTIKKMSEDISVMKGQMMVNGEKFKNISDELNWLRTNVQLKNNNQKHA